MSENMSEAPVSWTVRYITPEGFDAMLTLRGTDTKTVLTTAKQAVQSMAAAGCKPQIGSNGHTTPATNGAEIGSNGHTTPATNGAEIGSNGQAVPTCPTHGPMKQSKHGGFYCPAKIADNDGTGKPVYCKAKAGAQ
jgi:hypothetical protein